MRTHSRNAPKEWTPQEEAYLRFGLAADIASHVGILTAKLYHAMVFKHYKAYKEDCLAMFSDLETGDDGKPRHSLVGFREHAGVVLAKAWANGVDKEAKRQHEIERLIFAKIKESDKDVDDEARRLAAEKVGKMSAEKDMTEEEKTAAMVKHYISIRKKLMLKHLQEEAM